MLVLPLVPLSSNSFMTDLRTLDIPYQGQVFGLSGNVLLGWVWQPSSPSERVVIEVYHNGTIIGAAVADQLEGRLVSAHIGDGLYGFSLPVPDSVINLGGKLRVRVANRGCWLQPEIDLATVKIVSRIDSDVRSDGGLFINGWVQDSTNPHAVLEVLVLCEGVLLKKLKANAFNPRSPAHLSRHGFHFSLPFDFADAKPHRVEVVTSSGMQLAGSPITILCYPEGEAEYFVQQDKTLDRINADTFAQLLEARQTEITKSVSMDYYDSWYAHFGKIPKNGESSISQVQVLIFDRCAYPRECIVENTLASLLGQQANITQIYIIVSDFYRRDLVNERVSQWMGSIRPLGFSGTLEVSVMPGLQDGLVNIAQTNGFTLCMEVGDRLAENSLALLLQEASQSNCALIYTDHDHDSLDGYRSRPIFKPAWDLDLFFNENLLSGAFLVCSKGLHWLLQDTREASSQIVELLATSDIQGFSYAIAAACIKRQAHIKHLPHVCCHRRHDASDSANPKLPAAFLQVIWPFEVPRITNKGTIKTGRSLTTFPIISIIIPTRDRLDLLETCIASIESKTTYANWELLIVDNQSIERETLEYFEAIKSRGHKVVDYPHPFNFSAINNHAVAQANGDVLVFLNNDTEVITPAWLEEMLSLLLRDDVGIVGAKLLWPNGMVQHGGVLLGINRLAGYYGETLFDDDNGYLSTNQVARRMSAVTAACLMIRKADYLAVGGFDQFGLPVAYNDVDLCLKIEDLGRAILWTPHAKLYHNESASRGKDQHPKEIARAHREFDVLRSRWGAKLLADRFYNPNLNLDNVTGTYNGLALPPRPISLR